MMKRILLFSLFSLYYCWLNAQVILSGQISDESGQPLVGATIAASDNTIGTVTDYNGYYTLELETGKLYSINFSYVGYETHTEEVEADTDRQIDIVLKGSQVTEEVKIVADIAIDRETPVAFTNIPTKKLQEELASQDLPMILNTTPGAYATQSGGGDGDARITIRGFNQRNVAVMLDGIPVNDMENGSVYWSNWFGLDLVTKTMQVQRGLGASKLAIPSIGGTINILTKGIESKRNITFSQEYGSGNLFRSTLALTTGRMKGGWGISAAGSYKQGQGIVDQTWTKGYFWYLRVDKTFGKHMISLSGFGAPQEHGQRLFQQPITTFDKGYATKLYDGDYTEGYAKNTEIKQLSDLLRTLTPGTAQYITTQNRITELTNYLAERNFVDTTGAREYGMKYNPHWNNLTRYGYKDGDTLSGETEKLHTRVNYYHKPQFSLRHSWEASPRLFWSNVAYLSIGTGGGTATEGTFATDLSTGLPKIQDVYNAQVFPRFGRVDTISKGIIRSSRNDHFWYGLLSTVQYKIDHRFTFSGGVDLRNYRGNHFREVYDLLGGKVFRNGVGNVSNDARVGYANALIKEGDKMAYNNAGFVRWGGAFGLLEYKQERWSAFFNLSSAISQYKVEDYFKPKKVSLADTTFYVSYDKPITYKGTLYDINSAEAKDQVVGWITIPSFTIKGGASFDLDEKNTIFINTGYINKAQRIDNVINQNRNNVGTPVKQFNNYENEKILAFEFGANHRSERFSMNFNTYLTNWKNKPLDSPPTVPEDPSDPNSDRITVNVPGIDALHIGTEFDFSFQPTKKLALEGTISVADWRWTSGGDTVFVDLPSGAAYPYTFDARGVHVGDAAQIQLGGLVRYEPIKNLYFKLKSTYFGKNYSNFSPESLQGANAGRDSWKMPAYNIVDLHTGYSFNIKKINLSWQFTILNLLNTKYISDATNNDNRINTNLRNFDAASASVFFGLGRRFNTSVRISF